MRLINTKTMEAEVVVCGYEAQLSVKDRVATFWVQIPNGMPVEQFIAHFGTIPAAGVESNAAAQAAAPKPEAAQAKTQGEDVATLSKNGKKVGRPSNADRAAKEAEELAAKAKGSSVVADVPTTPAKKLPPAESEPQPAKPTITIDTSAIEDEDFDLEGDEDEEDGEDGLPDTGAHRGGDDAEDDADADGDDGAEEGDDSFWPPAAAALEPPKTAPAKIPQPPAPRVQPPVAKQTETAEVPPPPKAAKAAKKKEPVAEGLPQVTIDVEKFPTGGAAVLGLVRAAVKANIPADKMVEVVANEFRRLANSGQPGTQVYKAALSASTEEKFLNTVKRQIDAVVNA